MAHTRSTIQSCIATVLGMYPDTDIIMILHLVYKYSVDGSETRCANLSCLCLHSSCKPCISSERFETLNSRHISMATHFTWLYMGVLLTLGAKARGYVCVSVRRVNLRTGTSRRLTEGTGGLICTFLANLKSFFSKTASLES